MTGLNLETHPFVNELVATGKFDVSFPYANAEEDRRDYSLTLGVLTGAGLITPTPLTLTNTNEVLEETGQSEVIFIYELGSRICGHKNIIHGGLLATLFDEGLCLCGFRLLPNKAGVTASLNISYVSPTHANSLVILWGKTTKVEGRKVWVEGKTFLLPRTPEYQSQEDLILTAKAELLAVEPKWAAKLSVRSLDKPTQPAELTNGSAPKGEEEAPQAPQGVPQVHG